MRRKEGPRLLPEAFDSDPLNMNCFLTLHQGIQFLMSQQSTPLSPIVHSESSLTPVEEKKKKKKQKHHSQGRVEAARSQLRIGISASQGQDMEYLNSAHTLNMLNILPA